MKRLFVYSVIGVLGLSWFGGCSEETKGTKTETTTKSPGGTTTNSSEQKADKSGDNPTKAP